MDDSQLDCADDVASIMQGILSEHLSPAAFADDYKLLGRTKSAFKQAVRDEKKMRAANDEEKRALEMDIAHSKARLTEMKGDCDRLQAELSSVEEEIARLKMEEEERNAHIGELKREIKEKQIAQLRVLKANSERNLSIANHHVQKLEKKIAARAVGAFPINENQNLVFRDENLRLETA